jgi:hypothetical protein
MADCQYDVRGRASLDENDVEALVGAVPHLQNDGDRVTLETSSQPMLFPRPPYAVRRGQEVYIYRGGRMRLDQLIRGPDAVLRFKRKGPYR